MERLVLCVLSARLLNHLFINPARKYNFGNMFFIVQSVKLEF